METMGDWKSRGEGLEREAAGCEPPRLRDVKESSNATLKEKNPPRRARHAYTGFFATMSHMGVNAPVTPPSAQPTPPAWSMTWVLDVPAGTRRT